MFLLLDLKAHHQPLRKELLAALEQVLDKNNFILGNEVNELEENIAAYCQTRYGVGVSSGTDALLAALMALDIKSGDEVITTPLSFFATVGAIVRLGARPVFVDIDPVTYNLDPSRLEAAVTPRTKAIIPVHLYGQCADMDPILQIATTRGLAVLEDAAQAIGSEYRDKRRAGNIGVAGCLRFSPARSRRFGGWWQVVTNDETLAERLADSPRPGGKAENTTIGS